MARDAAQVATADRAACCWGVRVLRGRGGGEEGLAPLVGEETEGTRAGGAAMSLLTCEECGRTAGSVQPSYNGAGPRNLCHGCATGGGLRAVEGAVAAEACGAIEADSARRCRMVREKPPAVPWVVEGLVVRGMLTVVNGREGEGKSLLAMALAAGVATGQDEGGLVCRPGCAVIVDAENGKAEIHRRVRTLELPDRGVECFEAEGFDLRRDLPDLEAMLEGYRPDLLVLDSYRSLWGGEENDSREVSQVLDPLRNLIRRYDAGTLLSAPLWKGNRRRTAARRRSVRAASWGSSWPANEGDPDPTRCYLGTWKCRPAERPPKRWMRLAVERGRVYIEQSRPARGGGAIDRRASARRAGATWS